MKITIAQAPAHRRGTAQGKAGGGRVAQTQSGSQAGTGPEGPDLAQDGGLRLTRPVVLVGMMGSGKTAVGTALARLLGVPFLDSDEEIERAAQMTVSEIFARDGEPFFRDRESEVLARLLAGVPAVVSTGGGAFMAERNRTAIAERGVSVWLKADLDLLWNRVRHKNTRPLLRTSDPKGTLARLLADREPVYALAQVVVEAQPGLSIEDMAHKVIAALRAQPGAFATKGE